MNELGMDPDQVKRVGQTEPHGELREMATTTWSVFCAFVQSGFTASQAMSLTREFMRVTLAGPTDGRSS